MKKITYILLIALLLLSACTKIPTDKIDDVPDDNIKTSAITFMEEYTAFNDQLNEKSGENYINVTISEDNPIKYATLDEVMTLLKGGTGVIYFGYPTCPWCRRTITPFLEQAREDRVDEILYFNAKDLRDVKELDTDGKIITTTKAGAGYNELLAALGEEADIYEGLNDDSIKRLYFPTIYFIKDGKIIAKNSGTGAYQEHPEDELSTESLKTLKDEFHDGFIRTFRDVCDKAC